MPYLAGSTVDRRLMGGRRLAVSTALWICRQAAEGLAALHDAGWTHCDVKPANIRVSPEGHATVMDLGMARQSGELQTDQPLCGTASYLAPEATRSGPVSPAVDVYGLGCTLFELVSGQRPFYGRDAAALARAHREEVPPAIDSLVVGAPRGFAPLVRQMLAKDPLRRPTAAEVADRLSGLEIVTFGAAA
jgi:serine/threonine-protein kinase